MSYDSTYGTFEATDSLDRFGSSFVEELAFDAESGELLVALDSGSQYLYTDVSRQTWDDFKNAHSKGQFYNNWIKRGKAAKSLGEVGWDTEVLKKSHPAPSMASVTVNSPSTTTGGAYFSLSGSDLTPAAVVAQMPEKFRHEVRFVVDGGNNVKSYVVDATSVSEACFALSEVAESLDIDVTVKEVTVYFE